MPEILVMKGYFEESLGMSGIARLIAKEEPAVYHVARVVERLWEQMMNINFENQRFLSVKVYDYSFLKGRKGALLENGSLQRTTV